MNSLKPISEKELLLRLQEGDAHAFSLLYRQYYSQLYLHAYNRLRDREAAKDLVHDLFANIWAKHRSIHVKEGLSSYLYKSVRNRVIDHVARQTVNLKYIQSLSEFLQRGNNTTDHLVREREFSALIEKEIEKLSPQVKMVFELSRKDRLTHREIANELGLSENTVRSYIKDALRALKVKFGALLLTLIYALLKLF